LYLSGDNESLRIGNFVGDFVKGNQVFSYPNDIQEGIMQHRRIDQFTDVHLIVLESKKRLRAKYRHYAPVIVDMFYDHFLAKNWASYSSIRLKDFTGNFYKIAKDNIHLLPENAVSTLGHMSKTDWLYNYQFIEGIDQALAGMARRTKFESGMENACIDLQANYGIFKAEFEEFFEDLQGHFLV